MVRLEFHYIHIIMLETFISSLSGKTRTSAGMARLISKDAYVVSDLHSLLSDLLVKRQRNI